MPCMRARSLLVLLAAFTLQSIGLTYAQQAQAQQVKVNPGDSLWAIAKRYDTTVEALRAANGLTSDDLRAGTTLMLPEASNATPETVTVRPGDTLYDIALAFGMSVDDLINANDLSGTVIRPGQTLRLHSAEPAPAPLVVTVHKGDSLWQIARTYGVELTALNTANGLTMASVLQPGDSVVIPGRYAPTDTDQGGAAAPIITVNKGDTLWSIAHRYQTSVAALMSANSLSSERVLAGQQLRIVPLAELARAVPQTTDPVPHPSIASSMIWPLIGPITSRYGYRRLTVAGSNFHTGLDIDGETGDPIHAAVAGTVTLAGWNGGYGNCVIITNGDTEYYYGHASVVLVKVGDVVNVGDVIAKVGNTGHSTGSHLHFEIRVDGKTVDPLPVLDSQASR